eukprot:2256447-Pleurochrysis_carterae.AAC.5
MAVLDSSLKATPLAAEDAEPLRVLFDGKCAVCNTNVAILNFFDRRGRLRFVDISVPNYLPDAHGGVTYEQAMRHIYLLGPGSDVRTGSEAVLAAYAAAGLGWLVFLLRSPPIRWAVDLAYRLVSHHRHTLSRFVPGGRRLADAVGAMHNVD